MKVFEAIKKIKEITMESLAYTKWIDHIVFIPKYHRKAIYGQIRKDIRDIIKELCVDIKE